MAEPEPTQRLGLTVRNDQPLMGLIEQRNGQEVTRYFTEEPGMAAAVGAVEAALSAVGAWGDLDWHEMEQALDRIRHESPPSPPIDL